MQKFTVAVYAAGVVGLAYHLVDELMSPSLFSGGVVTSAIGLMVAAGVGHMMFVRR